MGGGWCVRQEESRCVCAGAGRSVPVAMPSKLLHVSNIPDNLTEVPAQRAPRPRPRTAAQMGPQRTGIRPGTCLEPARNGRPKPAWMRRQGTPPSNFPSKLFCRLG